MSVAIPAPGVTVKAALARLAQWFSRYRKRLNKIRDEMREDNWL